MPFKSYRISARTFLYPLVHVMYERSVLDQLADLYSITLQLLVPLINRSNGTPTGTSCQGQYERDVQKECTYLVFLIIYPYRL